MTRIVAIEQMTELLDRVNFPGYTFRWQIDQAKRVEVWATYYDEDIETGKLDIQETRHWLIPEHFGESQIIQTLFKCCLTSKEHYTREHFTYRGRSVFGPHHDIEALWAISPVVAGPQPASEGSFFAFDKTLPDRRRA